MSIYKELKERGLLHDHTDGIEKVLDKEKSAFYIGADPSADSLHVGNLLGLVTAKRLKDAGLKAILIVGGGTVRIGDPKPDAERPLLPEEEIEKNKKAIETQIKKILKDDDLIVVDNHEWLGKLSFINFLRDIGKHFTVNNLIKKDAIAERLKSDIGLSYTEFAYPILQAYDFLELYKRYNCKLQIGGSDQWGNIVAGVDLIRKKEGVEAYAFTFPLLVDKSSGKKFGKSEGNAIWLSEKKLSVYKFYQFFINVSDEMVIDLLKKLTFLSLGEIAEIESKWQKAKHERLAQKTLAREVTSFVHGEEKAQAAANVSEILFGKSFNSLDEATKKMLIDEAPSFAFKKLQDFEMPELLIKAELASSKREAKEFLSAGAVKIFDKKTDLDYKIQDSDFVDGILILKRGKKNLAVIYK